MSIETLLTLGLAAAILVAAVFLRLLVGGAVRLYCKVSGRPIPWRHDGPDVPSVRSAKGRTDQAPARTAAALGNGLTYVLATVGTWLRGAGSVIARSTRSAHASLSPRIASGTRKGLGAAGQKIRSAAIVTVASGQHLGRVTTERVKEISEERAAQAPVDEPSDARVIVLDREWDPLTDPLEDQPASNAR